MTQSIILSSNGVHRLHHAFFVPTGKIIATLLIVHGMSEHSGRYDSLAQFLANHGVLVATYDQLGHGQTAKNSDELGFFDEKHPVQTLCKDVIIMADALKAYAKTHSTDPVRHLIMGHSMGSFMVRTVLIHHATSFDGVILMGTSHGYGVLNRLGSMYLTALNRIAPYQRNLGFGYVMNQYLLAQLNSPISPSPFAWLSENIDAIKAFEADELCGFVFTNNGFFALSQFIKKANTPSWYQHLNCPILLISGKDDPVGRMGQDIDDLQDELLKQGKTVQVQLYANMRHEPLHEVGADRVHGDILTWIKSVVV